MTLSDLRVGRRIQVSFPPPGMIGKHWVDAVVVSRGGTRHWFRASVMLVDYSRSDGLNISHRDCAAGLVRSAP